MTDHDTSMRDTAMGDTAMRDTAPRTSAAARDLRDPDVARVLDRLHREARADRWNIPLLLPRVLAGRLTGRSLMKTITPAMMREMYLPVSRQDGLLLYALARGAGATRVVEFGTSFGISTIYLAAAVRGNGGGTVATSEIEPSKCRAAEENIRQAGLADLVEVLEGDARETLAEVDGPIDLAFLDGWKDLYVPVLDLLLPKLRRGALVVADNVNFADTRPYLARVREDPDFVSALLPGGRTECSWYLP
jgi:predicted O-methyltransferase YrrM